MYYLYILRNSKNHLYVGVSSNLKSRTDRHNSGGGAEFTRRNKNFKLVGDEKRKKT